MDRRIFIKAGTMAGVSLNAFPILTNSRAEGQSVAESVSGVGNQPSGDSRLAMGPITTYSYPRIIPVSPNFTVKAGGHDVTVIATSVGPFAAFACAGSVEVSIEVPNPVKGIRIAPARHQIKARIDQKRVFFTLPHPMNLLIEIEGMEQFFLFANAPERAAPSQTDASVHYFRAGQVYEVGELRLHDNETLYIEGGAVVRGCIRATSAKNVRIAGHGVLDGSYYPFPSDKRRAIVLEDCRDSCVEDIILTEPTSWMIVLGACQNVAVRNVKELGSVISSDGLDIIGSSHIRVENCFFRNGDDCIVVKSMDLRGHSQDATLDFTFDVEDIVVSGCSFMTSIGGQIFEIGHELRASSVKNIHIRDCDILDVRGYGAPFGIHVADHATVSNVLFENIRVEHHYNKLIEFRIVESRWSHDKQRGQIRNITLRNIDVTVLTYNPGYSVSVIGGYDATHTIEGVQFENFRMNGKLAKSADDIDLFTNGHASKMSFR